MNPCDLQEREALLALNATPGLGNARIRQMVAHCGSARRVLRLPAEDLARLAAVPERIRPALLRFDRDRFLDGERRLIAAHGVTVLTERDGTYPALLREIPDAPAVLYVRGEIPDEGWPLAVVGSRRASVYGTGVAEKLAAQLAESGFTIVSGLARGIDTAAHRGCLRGGGRTVAVLGCGLSVVYPPENEKLLERIAGQGAVITEFPMTAGPDARHFPRRNRIISGMALGVVVVEAAGRSGALITADFALEQGREVFAVPGPVDRAGSTGTHRLIQQGARLAAGIDDIIEELAPQIVRARGEGRTPSVSRGDDPGALTPTEAGIMACLDRRPVSEDELVLRCGMAVPALSPVLLRLEMTHRIRRLPGRYFVVG